MKTISIKKVSKAIKVAYGVSDNEEVATIAAMFINLKAA